MLLGVDVGGTFTDAVLLDDDARVHTAKLPSTPADQSVAVLAAVRAVLPSSSAFVATVMPCAKCSTSRGCAPASPT
jgi:N-methylhydantoinase A/oxoprolinase/acetone carboxylase beta subunit